MKYCQDQLSARNVGGSCPLLHTEMQRHKEPLDFTESPCEGVRHCQSPVFAARRPFLASSISAELLSSQWVSPQFQNENQSSINFDVGKKRQIRGARAASKRTKTKKKDKEIVHVKENNLFPPLDFPSNTNETFKYPADQPSDPDVPVFRRRSKRKKISQPLNDVTLVNQQQTNNITMDKNQFLFSLGSPKPSTILGEILVHETPENQMFERHMLDRRLRIRNCKLHDKNGQQL